jgi:hypothetical protein
MGDGLPGHHEKNAIRSPSFLDLFFKLLILLFKYFQFYFNYIQISNSNASNFLLKYFLKGGGIVKYNQIEIFKQNVLIIFDKNRGRVREEMLGKK